MTSVNISEESLGPISGKVVLITGGASGIGRASAELFHAQGAKVVIGDVNEKLGVEAASAIGKSCTFQVCDVTSWSSQSVFFETAVQTYGKIDVVLANAGVPEIENIFTDVIDEANGKLREPKYVVLDIDLKGVFSTVKLAKYYFEKQKSPGAIVMTSSVAGVIGDAYLPAYTASKHGIIGLMRAIAKHSPFSVSKISVNCVAPFMTETGFITDEMRPRLEAAKVPINKASSVAVAVAYLATTGVTGQTIYVADNEFTELEGPIRELRPEWLGKKNAVLLGPPIKDATMLTAGHDKVI